MNILYGHRETIIAATLKFSALWQVVSLLPAKAGVVQQLSHTLKPNFQFICA